MNIQSVMSGVSAPVSSQVQGSAANLKAAAPPAQEAVQPSESFESGSSFIVQHADASKLSELKQQLAQNPNCHITDDFAFINGFAVQGNPEELSAEMTKLQGLGCAITADQNVGFPDKNLEALEETVDIINGQSNIMLGVDKLHEQGITGKGSCICVIDTGVSPHPDLGNRIIAFHDCVNGHNDRPYDDNGHGTHCAGICASDGKTSDGKFVGVAPEANIVGVKVLDAWGNGTTSNIVKGIQWAITHKGEYNIDVINLSLGGKIRVPRLMDPITWAVQAASAVGITCVVAAGNEGSEPETIDSPGNAPRAITVGALDDNGTVQTDDDGVAHFSSRGPTRFDKLAKPDLVAPGVDITSLDNDSDGYVRMSGTSMATPFVAGVAALLEQVKPNIRPSQTKKLLMKTTSQFEWNVDRFAQGAGIVNPTEAVGYLVNGGKIGKL